MNILIVEDHPVIGLGLQDMLAELGFPNAEVAPDLPTANSILDSGFPHFAILDVNLGGTLVFPFADTLRNRGIPFLFATGEHPDAIPQEWRGHKFLSKPVDAAALAQALKTMAL